MFGCVAVTGVVLGKVEAAVDAAGKDAMPVGVGFAGVCTIGVGFAGVCTVGVGFAGVCTVGPCGTPILV